MREELNDLIEEMDLPFPESMQNGPWHVMRILGGAETIFQFDGDKNAGLIVSDGNTYRVRQDHLELYVRTAEAIQHRVLGLHNIDPPDPKAIEVHELMYEMAFNRIFQERRIRPELVRAFLWTQGKLDACLFYRMVQPAAMLNNDHMHGGRVQCDTHGRLNFQIAPFYDAVIVPRMADPNGIGTMQRLQQHGVSIIYETDDLLDENVPDWNPNKQHITPQTIAASKTIQDLADAIFCTTPELRDSLGHPEKTFVLKNALDLRLWPTEPKKREEDKPVRIMWQGSPTHEADLAKIVEPLKAVMRQCGKAVEMLFWGHVPDGFLAKAKTKCGPAIVPKQEFKDQLVLEERGVGIRDFPTVYAELAPDIVVAPIVDCAFNQSKSELKVLEGWALGVPVVASPVAPYKRAIQHNVNGLLAQTKDDWRDHLLRLISSPGERERLGTAGRKSLEEGYQAQQVALEYERAIMLTVRKRPMPRFQAREAIEKRLEELNALCPE